MTIEKISLEDIFYTGLKHIKNQTIFSGLSVEPSPDTGINILNNKNNGITMRISCEREQVELLIDGYRFPPSMQDINIRNHYVGDLFSAIDNDKNSNSIEQFQIKELLKEFILQS